MTTWINSYPITDLSYFGHPQRAGGSGAPRSGRPLKNARALKDTRANIEKSRRIVRAQVIEIVLINKEEKKV